MLLWARSNRRTAAVGWRSGGVSGGGAGEVAETLVWIYAFTMRPHHQFLKNWNLEIGNAKDRLGLIVS